ncbi:hypothetical protein ACFPRL_13415 [Pseudoclavibacter helvolus]
MPERWQHRTHSGRSEASRLQKHQMKHAFTRPRPPILILGWENPPFPSHGVICYVPAVLLRWWPPECPAPIRSPLTTESQCSQIRGTRML